MGRAPRRKRWTLLSSSKPKATLSICQCPAHGRAGGQGAREGRKAAGDGPACPKHQGAGHGVLGHTRGAPGLPASQAGLQSCPRLSVHPSVLRLCSLPPAGSAGVPPAAAAVRAQECRWGALGSPGGSCPAQIRMHVLQKLRFLPKLDPQTHCVYALLALYYQQCHGIPSMDCPASCGFSARSHGLPAPRTATVSHKLTAL